MNLLDHLKVLCTIVDEGSFRSASKALYRSQPALSASIKNLEETLGFELFDRAGYRPTLRDKGKKIYDRAQKLLVESDNLLNYSQFLATGCEPEVRLALSFSVPVKRLISAMQQIQHESRQARVSIDIKHPYQVIDDLLCEKNDFCITVMQPEHHALEQKYLYTLNFVPVFSPRSYGNQPSEPLDISVFPYADILQVDLPSGVVQYPSFRKSQWTVNDINTLKEVIQTGVAWGLLPEYCVREELDKGEFREIKSDEISRVKVQIGLLHLKSRPLGIVAQEMEKAIFACDWMV